MTRVWVFCLALLPVLLHGPGNPDYKKEFGTDYVWAVNWLKQHDATFAKYAAEFSIEPKLLKAIVFPELIRYNALLNTMEVETLKYLYVSEGKHYANFSVGFFQMKPSFAESVETDAHNLAKNTFEKFGWPADNNDEQSRKKRVRRLSNINEQLNYLCAFYLICERKFNTQSLTSAEDRVRLLATCYNAGYHHAADKLQTLREKKHFNGFNYSAISWHYYNNE